MCCVLGFKIVTHPPHPLSHCDMVCDLLEKHGTTFFSSSSQPETRMENREECARCG